MNTDKRIIDENNRIGPEKPDDFEIMNSKQVKYYTIQAIRWCLEDAVGTGSARIIAKILLNCYNERAYPKVELAGLGSLDTSRFAMVMGIMQLRHMGIEPHQIVNDGDNCMDRIRKMYGIRRCRT